MAGYAIRLMNDVSFKDLRRKNVFRCEEVFFKLKAWSPTDWGCAVAGEVGELCNLLKKRRRGEKVSDTLIANEIADAVIYLDLLAARLGIDLAEAVKHKFNLVSKKKGSKVYL